MELKIGDRVNVTLTDRNDYWKGNMKGRVVGFTPSGRVKVHSHHMWKYFEARGLDYDYDKAEQMGDAYDTKAMNPDNVHKIAEVQEKKDAPLVEKVYYNPLPAS